MSAECAVCGQSPLMRSSVRWYEWWRKVVLRQRPFRCVRCRHRAWMPVSGEGTVAAVSGLDASGAPPQDVDLTLLDGFATDTDPSPPTTRVSSLPM